MKTQMFSIQDDAPLVEQAKLRASLTLVPDVSNYEDLERPAPGVAARGVHPAALGSLVGLYAVMLLSFWVSFARSGPAALVLTVVTVLMIMYFSLIVGGIILADSAVAGEVQRSFAEFLRGRVEALLQTLTRFPRLGSCTVKVSCDERFQRTAFYRRGHPMGGALVLSIRHQLP